SLVKEKIRLSRLTIDNRRDKMPNGAVQVLHQGAGKTSMDRIRSLIEKILSYDRELLQQRKMKYHEALSNTNYLLLGIIIYCVIMLLFFIRKVWFYFREKTRTEQELKQSYERYNFVTEATSDT